MMKKAIEYAMRQNAQEGLHPTPETIALLDRVAAGELTFDDARKIIHQNHKKYQKLKSK